MDSLLSFPVGLFHPLQHAGLSRRSLDDARSGSYSARLASAQLANVLLRRRNGRSRQYSITGRAWSVPLVRNADVTGKWALECADFDSVLPFSLPKQ